MNWSRRREGLWFRSSRGWYFWKRAGGRLDVCFLLLLFLNLSIIPLSTVKPRLTRCVSLIYLVKRFASHDVIWLLEQSAKYQLSTGFRNLQSSRIPVLLKSIRGFSYLILCSYHLSEEKEEKVDAYNNPLNNIFKHCERDQKLIIFPNIDTFPSALQLMIPWTIRLKELFFKLTHSTQRHPRASIIHRKRILQQRGRDYSQISNNTLHRKQKECPSANPFRSFSTLFNARWNRWRYLVELLALPHAPPPMLVIIIGWQSSARILIRDFTSWPLELSTTGRTRKQSRWNVKIDTGREVATRIETAVYTRRLALLRYNRDFTRLFDPRRSFDTARAYSLAYSRQSGSDNPAKINPFRKLPIEIMERLTAPPTFGFVYV